MLYSASRGAYCHGLNEVFQAGEIRIDNRYRELPFMNHQTCINYQKKFAYVIALVVTLLCSNVAAQNNNQAAFTMPLFSPFQTGENNGSVITIVKDFMHSFSDLDYATSKELVIALPGTGHELSYNWGFVGSGDLFSPLPTIKGQLRPIQSFVAPADSATPLIDLGKVVAQNELIKKSKQLPLIKWLSESELSPIKLLIVKTILLVKNSATLGVNALKGELFRLLFRLSLVDDVVLFDVSKPLTSLIPESIKLALDEMSPEIVSTINEVWAHVADSKNLLKTMSNDASGKTASLACITAYVFNDQQIAESCFDNSQQGIEKLIKQCDCSLLAYDDFVRFSKVGAPNPLLNPARKLVGYKTYGVVNLELSSSGLPAAVSEQLKQQAAAPVVMVSGVDGQTWVICKGEKLDALETAKVLTATFITTFKDYVAARKAVMTSSSAQAVEYRKALQAKELERSKMMTFLQTQHGKTCVKRLERALEALDHQRDVVGQSGFNVLKVEQEKIIASLTAEYEKKMVDLARLQASAARTKGDAGRIAQMAVTQAQKACELAQQALLDYQKNCQAAEHGAVLQPVNPDNLHQKRAEYYAHISALRDMLRKNQTLSIQEQQEIQSCILELESKVKDLNPTQPVKPSLSLEQIIAQRESACAVYAQEVVLLRQELAQHQAGIMKIADPVIRMAAKLEFSSMQKGYEAYIASLEQQAARIAQENEKLCQLDAYKNILSLNSDALGVHELEDMQKLEYEVGYLMQTGGTNWLRHLLHSSSDIMDAMDDLGQGSLSEFKQVKENFFTMLGWIATHSDHVSENQLIYRYFIGLVLPEFLLSFDHCFQVLPQA